MKNIITALLVTVSVANATAQQQYTTSFGNLNGYNLNPAYVGLNGCIEGSLQFKKQWTGIKETPANGLFQIHSGIKSNFGIGLTANYWQAALLKNTQLGLSGAYHLSLGDISRLSFGATFGLNRFGLDAQGANVFDEDPSLAQNLSDGNMYADFGVLFTGKKLSLGIASPKIYSSALAFENNEFNIERYIVANANYRINATESILIIPSLVYRTIPNNGSSVDVMARAVFSQKYGVALGYRTNSGLLVAADLDLNDKLKLGYAYDAGMQKLAGMSSGSHEIILAIKICRPEKEEIIKVLPVPHFFKGTLIDENAKTPLANTNVILIDNKTGIERIAITDVNGNINMKIDTNTTYTVNVNDVNYEPITSHFSTSNSLETDIVKSINLTHKIAVLKGKVVNELDNTPIANAIVTIYEGTNTYDVVTDINGEFTFPLKGKSLNDKLAYKMAAKKEGFTSNENITVNGNLKEYGTLYMNDLNAPKLTLNPFKEGTDITEIIDIKPIYFELGKFSITNEAKIELDKVIEVMNKYQEMVIELGAHTDCRGSASGNLNLSNKRAISCTNYIKSKIINPERISGKGFGETQPKSNCDCNTCSEQDHKMDRRTEFKIVKIK